MMHLPYDEASRSQGNAHGTLSEESVVREMTQCQANQQVEPQLLCESRKNVCKRLETERGKNLVVIGPPQSFFASTWTMLLSGGASCSARDPTFL